MDAVTGWVGCALLALGLGEGPGRGGAVEERLVERGGGVLELAGGVLTRDGARLGVLGGELGRVRDLALDPAGPCFVAAEGGLFVLAPGVAHLDRVERREEAPPGAPRSVHVDLERRVWLATDRAVGVLEPSFHWGRTLELEELAAGPYALRAGGRGELLIASPVGEHRYRVDEGPPPRVTGVVLGEQRFDAPLAGPVLLAHGEELPLGATGEAAGGALLRFRLDGHHVWRELSLDTRVGGLAPGSHRLEVVAYDRDLRRSAPFAVPLVVAYPAALAPGVVVGGVLGAALGLAALLLWRARVRGASRAAALTSTALACALFLQVLAGLVPHGRGWPFMGFDMYTERYARGDYVYQALLIGLAPDGRELLIDPQTLGFAIDGCWQPLRPLIDGGEPVARSYLAAFRRRFPESPIRGLQVQARRTRLSAEGPVPVAPLVLYHFEEPEGEPSDAGRG